jgi:hypothetical protein
MLRGRPAPVRRFGDHGVDLNAKGGDPGFIRSCLGADQFGVVAGVFLMFGTWPGRGDAPMRCSCATGPWALDDTMLNASLPSTYSVVHDVLTGGHVLESRRRK